MSAESDLDTWLGYNANYVLKLHTYTNQTVKLQGVLKIWGGATGPTKRTISVYDTVHYANAQPKWHMGLAEWRRFWNFAEDPSLHFTANTYGRVKQNAQWKALYGVMARPLYFESPAMNGNAAVIVQSQVAETVACKICTIILPLTSMTVDHQKPQAGGDGQAIFKVFKALNLTTAAPHGRKGIHWQATAGFPAGIPSPTTGGNLNWAGVLFYSLLKESKSLGAFGNLCMHHALNLAPMCFHCNSKKGNWGYR